MSPTLVAEDVSAVSAELPLEQLRAAGIRIPRPAEVRDYVRQFPDIVPAVHQACDLTVAEFAGQATLSLEVYVDPEIDDSYLTLYVQKEGYDAATSEAIEGIFEIYAEGMINSAGWMMVMQDIRGGVQHV